MSKSKLTLDAKLSSFLKSNDITALKKEIANIPSEQKEAILSKLLLEATEQEDKPVKATKSVGSAVFFRRASKTEAEQDSTPKTEIVRLLIKNGAIVNITTDDGVTPLHNVTHPSKKPNPTLVKALLEAGANPNAALKSPIERPYVSGLFEFKNFDESRFKEKYEEATTLALERLNDPRIIKAIIEFSANAQQPINPSIITALREADKNPNAALTALKDPNISSLIYKFDPNKDSQSTKGTTPLHNAALQLANTQKPDENAPVVKLLVDYGANIAAGKLFAGPKEETVTSLFGIAMNSIYASALIPSFASLDKDTSKKFITETMPTILRDIQKIFVKSALMTKGVYTIDGKEIDLQPYAAAPQLDTKPLRDIVANLLKGKNVIFNQEAARAGITRDEITITLVESLTATMLGSGEQSKDPSKGDSSLGSKRDILKQQHDIQSSKGLLLRKLLSGVINGSGKLTVDTTKTTETTVEDTRINLDISLDSARNNFLRMLARKQDHAEQVKSIQTLGPIEQRNAIILAIQTGQITVSSDYRLFDGEKEIFGRDHSSSDGEVGKRSSIGSNKEPATPTTLTDDSKRLSKLETTLPSISENNEGTPKGAGGTIEQAQAAAELVVELTRHESSSSQEEEMQKPKKRGTLIINAREKSANFNLHDFSFKPETTDSVETKKVITKGGSFEYKSPTAPDSPKAKKPSSVRNILQKGPSVSALSGIFESTSKGQTDPKQKPNHTANILKQRGIVKHTPDSSGYSGL